MAWMDDLWDDDAGLLWAVRRDRHLVRETSLYALGLLERGDADRAQRALEKVVENQFDAPGSEYDGTFRRSPEEPDPPSDPVMWIHYDPNWRQFIGTTLALICDERGDVLDGGLRRSIDRAVESEAGDRVSPHYANIALMKAWLDAWAGRIDTASAFALQIAEAFEEHGAFLEYNSPTYYGIDLIALAMWRSAPDPLPRLGEAMESALWRDIARFYHPGMRNLCGPFDRMYGMDMTSYATPLGLWMWSALGRDEAPFPDPSMRFRHPHDFCFAPLVNLFDVHTIDLLHEERTIEQVITTYPARVATAWLSEDVMFGGHAGPPSGIGWFQHRHATAHWLQPDGTVGWLALRPECAAEAVASPGELRITARSAGPLALETNVDTLPFDVSGDLGPDEAGRLVYEATAGATLVIRADE